MKKYVWIFLTMLGLVNLKLAEADERPFLFTADDLGKLVINNPKEFATYRGKTLLITGEIESLNEPYIFLKTDQTYKTGQPVKICIRMLDFRSNKAKIGELITVGGELEVDGVFGPALRNGRTPLPNKK